MYVIGKSEPTEGLRIWIRYLLLSSSHTLDHNILSRNKDSAQSS